MDYFRKITVLLLLSLATAASCGEEINSLGMKLCPISAGTFQMGTDLNNMADELAVDFPLSVSPRWASDESPRHPVKLTRPFDISAQEVTVDQFRQFVEATGYRTTAERSGEGIVGFSPVPVEQRKQNPRQRAFERREQFTWSNPGFRQDASHPVVGVSWEDAQAFCKWLSERESAKYRLPTEAEWEYACRAGSDAWFSFGKQFRKRIHRYANIGNIELELVHKHHPIRQWLLDPDYDPPDHYVFTSPAGSFQPNVWGLYDMHGNVWEWCEDYYAETYYRQFKPDHHSRQPAKLDTDPFISTRGNEHSELRVIRGGCWYNGPLFCRSATRSFFEATDAACYIGFRVVRVPNR